MILLIGQLSVRIMGLMAGDGEPALVSAVVRDGVKATEAMKRARIHETSHLTSFMLVIWPSRKSSL